MLTDLEILDRCILLFSKPGRWTTKSVARDMGGKSCPVFSDKARAFDLEGAIRRAAGEDDRTAYARFVKDGRLRAHLGQHKNPFDWNDAPGRTQKHVQRLLEDFADEFRWKENM